MNILHIRIWINFEQIIKIIGVNINFYFVSDITWTYLENDKRPIIKCICLDTLYSSHTILNGFSYFNRVKYVPNLYGCVFITKLMNKNASFL